MIATKRVLATIPARGGSKRLPGKNLALLEGKPLLAYSIEAAFACEAIDRVAVSTEDESIASVAQEYGAEVIRRPVELATDEAFIGPACRHTMLEVEHRDKCSYDVHVLLQPTSPLRTAEHIDTGLKLLFEQECDSVLSVRACTDHPCWARVIKDGTIRPFLGSDQPIDSQRHQDLPEVYYPNGALYITYRSVLLETGYVLGDDIVPHVMAAEDSVDIDTELDFVVARAILRRRRADVV